MGLNFYDYDGIQPKLSPPKHFSRQCIIVLIGDLFLFVGTIQDTLRLKPKKVKVVILIKFSEPTLLMSGIQFLIDLPDSGKTLRTQYVRSCMQHLCLDIRLIRYVNYLLDGLS